MPVLVAERHENHAASARLDVLGCQSAQIQFTFEGFDQFGDGVSVVVATEVHRERTSVVFGTVARKL